MRTTLDLDQQSYRLVKALAAKKGVSMGKFVAEAVAAYCEKPRESHAKLGRSEAGFMTVDIGRPITSEEVADLIDE